QTLWSYAGSLRNFDARVGNWATAPRLTALLVAFLCFDLLFAAVYGDAALRAARDPDLLNESQRSLLHQLALPTVGADWFENALLLLLILSASWRLERKRRRDIATEALAKDLREANHADRRKDRWRPWFARKRKERWAYRCGRLACFLLALATTTKFAGVLAMILLMMMGRAI
ncbi:MAG: hypothetical protein IT478_11850, partial [Xanthomonadales bacterium]|nr:hypothetical protein [Xanthomonadales bacterium]